MKNGFLATLFGISVALAFISARAAAQSSTPSPALAATAAAPNHILAANELIEVKVFGEPDLDAAARIPEDGRISLPLIGEVAVAGKSVQDATRIVRERLAARFLVNPQVTISVVEQAKRLFTVIGQVQRPGTYRFPERQKLDLMQVIGIAGGYTRLADAAKITVKRHADGRDTVLRVNGKRLARDGKFEPFPVEAGDLITVGERLF